MEILTVPVLTALLHEAARNERAIRTDLRKMEEAARDLRVAAATAREQDKALREMFVRLFPTADLPTFTEDELDASMPEDHDAEPTEVEKVAESRKAFISHQLTDDEWLAVVPRTDAIESAIIELCQRDGFATPTSVQEYLEEHGRSETRDAVSTGISYLNRNDRIHSIGRAQWVMGEAAQPPIYEEVNQ